MVRQGLKRKAIPRRSKSRDDADADAGDHRMVAEFLTRVDVRDVNLDHGQAGPSDGVMQRDGGVRVGTRIDDNACAGVARGVDFVDHRAFVVGLYAVHRDAQLGGDGVAIRFDVGQCFCTIDAGLSCAEQIQVRAVQY